MELALPQQFVLLDTEYTAWEGSQVRKWSGPNEYREIIQVGMIRVVDSVEAAALKIYVKPVKNPILSDYIKDLTHITQEEVKTQGVSLESCVQQTTEFLGTDPAYSYGLDEVVIKENCDLIGIPYPLPLGRIADIRELLFPALKEINVDPTGYTSGTLIEAFGTATKRGAHDAVNDMRNLFDAITIISQAQKSGGTDFQTAQTPS